MSWGSPVVSRAYSEALNPPPLAWRSSAALTFACEEPITRVGPETASAAVEPSPYSVAPSWVAPGVRPGIFLTSAASFAALWVTQTASTLLLAEPDSVEVAAPSMIGLPNSGSMSVL